ncbi:hypothetical protein C8F04DRAFT_1403259, partial [Mycena alexandri]
MTDPEFHSILKRYDIILFAETDMLPGEDDTGVALLVRDNIEFVKSNLSSPEILVLDLGFMWLIDKTTKARDALRLIHVLLPLFKPPKENRRAVIIFQSVRILTQPLLARFWLWRCLDISADNSCLGKSSPVMGLDGVLWRFRLRQCSSRHGGLGECTGFIITTIHFHSWILHAANFSRATITSRTNVVLNESQLKTNERVVEIIHLLDRWCIHHIIRSFATVETDEVRIKAFSTRNCIMH